jgi:tRNA (guanine37-N1)-methyltransferase
MQIDVVTIFPDAFRGVLDASILGRAIEAGIVDVGLHDLRDWTDDKHRSVDDAPYGGGAGMVMRPEPWFRAIEELRSAPPAPHVVLCTPQGRPFTQEIAGELAQRDRLILCAARYEGVDERVREHLVDDEISIGDYVLSGGEIPAMVLIDAVVRLLPGALGSDQSTLEESFNDSLLEYPHYTRPAAFRDWHVPDVLLSGNHAEIARWRRGQRIRRTAQRRPDLLAGADVTQEELDEWALPDDETVE